jgi:D-alanine transaminase
MFIARMIVHYNGSFVEKSEVAISPDDRGFLFADGVYEVIRACRGRLFESKEHLERLQHGLKELRIEGVDAPGLEPIAKELIDRNRLQKGDALIYMQVTRGAAPRSHEFPTVGTSPTVYMESKAYTPPMALQQAGVHAILAPDQRWTRCDIKSISLLPNILANQRAREAGAFEAILCGDGLLHEGSHSSILFVKNNVLICPPLTNRLLPSITREVVIGLALADSIEVETRPCREGELFEFDEVLMLGTATEIVPITAVNKRAIGTGEAGSIARRLQGAFRRLVAL